MSSILNILSMLNFAGCEDADVGTYITMGVLVLLLGGFMLFTSLRNKKKNASTEEMKNSLKIGDKVQTIGGIIGTITEINNVEGTITVSTGTSTMVFNKQAVYAFGFYDAPKPASEQKPVENNQTIHDEFQSSENMDAINADFLDSPGRESVESKPKGRKSKKSTNDSSKFE